MSELSDIIVAVLIAFVGSIISWFLILVYALNVLRANNSNRYNG